MSTNGLDLWVKYFKGKTKVRTYVKNTKIPKLIAVYDDINGKRKIEDLADGHVVEVVVSALYEKRYKINYSSAAKVDPEDENVVFEKTGFIGTGFIGKPVSVKNPELKRIVAKHFINGGLEVKYNIAGADISCAEFTSKKHLIDSIRYGLVHTRGVSESVRDTFEPWLNGNHNSLTWHPNVSYEEKGQYGKYLGELIVGVLAFDKEHPANIIPISSSVGRFLVPTDSSFPGVDSFIEMKSGEVIPISSKFGKGAPASFFSNLLYKGVLHHSTLKKCIFKDIVEVAIGLGVNNDKGKKAKEILYEYGIREVLGFNRLKIKDTYAVFENLKEVGKNSNKTLSPESVLVTDAISKLTNKKEITATAFFCRTISDNLNNDNVSLDEIRKILVGKNFWQANLNKTDWENGRINFKFVKSGEANLKIIGWKSANNDINGDHGLISYELK